MADAELYRARNAKVFTAAVDKSQVHRNLTFQLPSFQVTNSHTSIHIFLCSYLSSLRMLFYLLQTEHVGAKVMFKANRTGEWLQTQPEAERKQQINSAVTAGRKLRKDDRTFQANIKQKLKDRLTHLRKERQQKDDNTRTRYEGWFQTAHKHGGLWHSEDDLNRNLAGLSKTKAKQVLVAQINIYTKVLKCTVDAADRKFVTKATVDELKVYVLKLIQTGSSPETEDLCEILMQPRSIIGREFSQMWEDGGTVKWVDGVFVDFILNNKVKFQEEIILTLHEVAVDIALGDLDIH